MKLSQLILTVFLLGMISPTLGIWEDASAETKAAMVKKTHEALERVETMFAERGYPFERPVIESGRAQRYSAPDNKNDTLDIYVPLVLNVRFRPANLEIFHFSNTMLRRKVDSEGSQLRIFPEKHQPKLSEDEVIEIAKEFVTAVFGKFPTNVSRPKARWETNYGLADIPGKGSVRGYQHGMWRIHFPRVTEEGYPFSSAGESVMVEFYENVGPVFVNNQMITQFDKVDFEPLKLEDVLDTARTRAKEVMKWKPVREAFEGLELDPEPFRANLEVVRPNHLTKRRSIAGDGGDIKGRLAWVIWFSCPPSQKRVVGVWIDAENKKFLGGDLGI